MADDFNADDAMEKTRKGNRLLDKMNKAMGAAAPVADDGAQKRDPSSNLGKYLHPKGGVKPADKSNSTVDANTAGSKVRVTQ